MNYKKNVYQNIFNIQEDKTLYMYVFLFDASILVPVVTSKNLT